MENISTTCEILLQVSQNHSPNRVCPLSKVSHCSSVTRIHNLRRLFIAKEKFHRVLMRRVFFNRRQIFPPIRGTSHSRSDCISVNTFLIQIYSYLPILMLYRLDNHFFWHKANTCTCMQIPNTYSRRGDAILLASFVLSRCHPKLIFIFSRRSFKNINFLGSA